MPRRGWEGARGLLLAFAGGLLAAVAHPPFGVWPGVFGFALIAEALDRAHPRRPLLSALARGWLAGFAYLLVGTWWIAEAFFVDAAAHAWQAPLAILFTAGGIGVFWGAAGWTYRLIAPRSRTHRILVFAAVWAGFEWLRGHVLTGFPWDLPGESWRAGSALSEAAALVGAYGLSFITVAIGAAPIALSRAVRPRPTGAVVALGSAALALLALWGYGAIRLAAPEPPAQPLRLRIVQPDLYEEPVWTGPLLRQRLDRLLLLTRWPAARTPDVVIWPEGALPYTFQDFFAPGSAPAAELADALRPGQTLFDGGSRIAEPGPRYYNTLLFLRRSGAGFTFEGVYDKYRLVPFGEFLPFPRVFGALGLTSLVQNGVSFSPGPVPTPRSVPGLPRFQPLICYEGLFPGFTGRAGGRPRWIVNVSDDAWFGRTTGPIQHLNLASYRAIEEGLPMVRATPTGVSAVIDARGRLKAHLGLSREGLIDADLPGVLPPTPYSQVGDLPFYVFILAGLSLSLIREARIKLPDPVGRPTSRSPR